ncbi:MAG: hypothetical protein FWC70_03565 [Defluviitaleaceae bacterium]|nr:hypothetical protein [Defluviitaleaceae bacterium]
MKKKFSVRIVCLLVAGVILSGALAVSAFNGSPYEVFKDALFNAMFYENYTLETEYILRVNGEIVESDSHFEIVGNNSNFSGDDYSFTFRQEGLTLRRSTGDVDSYGRQWYSVSTNRASSWEHNNSGTFSGIFGGSIQRDSSQVRLAELFLDLVVGDLRNNMYMTPQGDGVRRVSGAITGNQLPEMVRLLIDIAIEEETRHAGNFTPRPNQASWEMPIQSLVINRVEGVADIDSAGNLMYLRAGITVTAVNIFGESNLIEMEIVMQFSDLGTSDPQSPLDGIWMFTPHFMEQNFGRRYASVLFLLDDDGNICTENMGFRSELRDAGIEFQSRW